MTSIDHRIYRTFEEFEREELRRMEAPSNALEDELNQLFGESGDRKKRPGCEDDEE